MGRRPVVVIVAAVAALGLAAVPILLALAAPSGLGGLAPAGEATPSGEAINEVYWFVFGICAVVFVLVEATLVLFILRFRRGPEVAEEVEEVEGPQIHGNTRLEIIWTIIPAVILVVIAIVVLARSPAVEATGGDRSNELIVRVEGHQFYWRYVYPDGEIALDTLVLPVDRPVTLELTSYDVNHSWWVPDLTGKRDAIPGQVNELRFTPQTEGAFDGGCAELCGILHAVMPTTVEVVSEAQFADRLQALGGQDQSGDSQLALGQATWEASCAKCHGPEGRGDIGPAIVRSGTLVDEEALTTLLTEGLNNPDVEGYMPPVGRGWPDFQIQALIEYVRSNEQLAPAETGDGR
ncbi:MAG: cytochrome c oxidase subunit II [Gaiellaceae bacterium]